jgi:hypothetical protein
VLLFRDQCLELARRGGPLGGESGGPLHEPLAPAGQRLKPGNEGALVLGEEGRQLRQALLCCAARSLRRRRWNRPGLTVRLLGAGLCHALGRSSLLVDLGHLKPRWDTTRVRDGYPVLRPEMYHRRRCSAACIAQ